MIVSVRQATVYDLEKLYEIERECFTAEAFSKEQIMFLLHGSNSVGLVAQINGEIVGFIIGVLQHIRGMKTCHICTIDVATKHRRKGIGAKLLREAEQVFAKKGARVCCLEARTDNVTALKLYKRHGYTETEMLKDYYFEGAHGVRLIKQLSQ